VVDGGEIQGPRTGHPWTEGASGERRRRDAGRFDGGHLDGHGPETAEAPSRFASIDELLGLVDAFEKGTLPLERWNHRTRIAIAIVYVLMESPDEARERLRALVPSFNRHAGLDESAFAYHETLATLYLRVIDIELSSCRSDSLLDCVHELLDGPLGQLDFATRFYSPERLWSDEARKRFVKPDRHPIPAA
jgi:hypothetical protein